MRVRREEEVRVSPTSECLFACSLVFLTVFFVVVVTVAVVLLSLYGCR
jgi:hypothetical protein